MYELAQLCTDRICQDGEVRLTDGDSQSRGRLEICRDGQWWTVSRTGLLEDHGDEICGQLGFIARGKDALLLLPVSSRIPSAY